MITLQRESLQDLSAPVKGQVKKCNTNKQFKQHQIITTQSVASIKTFLCELSITQSRVKQRKTSYDFKCINFKNKHWLCNMFRFNISMVLKVFNASITLFIKLQYVLLLPIESLTIKFITQFTSLKPCTTSLLMALSSKESLQVSASEVICSKIEKCTQQIKCVL